MGDCEGTIGSCIAIPRIWYEATGEGTDEGGELWRAKPFMVHQNMILLMGCYGSHYRCKVSDRRPFGFSLSAKCREDRNGQSNPARNRERRSCKGLSRCYSYKGAN